MYIELQLDEKIVLGITYVHRHRDSISTKAEEEDEDGSSLIFLFLRSSFSSASPHLYRAGSICIFSSMMFSRRDPSVFSAVFQNRTCMKRPHPHPPTRPSSHSSPNDPKK